MKTTGEFTLHRYEIKFKKYNTPVYIIPFGDIHRSSSLCDVEKWLEFCKWAAAKKDAYFLGMGDYDDLLSTSERPILASHLLHESTTSTLEDTYRYFIDRLGKEIRFMKGRIIGLMEGNHFAKFQNGTTSTQRLCEALECRYLGVSSFISLILKYDTAPHNHTHRVVVWAHHGLSGGRTPGASINPVHRMIMSANADIYLMGHNHKKQIDSASMLHLTPAHHGEERLLVKTVIMARTGSFLRAYVPGKVSYVVDAAMAPTDIGVVKIELTPRRKEEGGVENRYIDLHASL